MRSWGCGGALPPRTQALREDGGPFKGADPPPPPLPARPYSAPRPCPRHSESKQVHAQCAGSLARLRSHLLAPPSPPPPLPSPFPSPLVHPGHRTPARTAGAPRCRAARAPSPSFLPPPSPGAAIAPLPCAGSGRAAAVAASARAGGEAAAPAPAPARSAARF